MKSVGDLEGLVEKIRGVSEKEVEAGRSREETMEVDGTRKALVRVLWVGKVRGDLEKVR
jgi:hypothetical protein